MELTISVWKAVCLIALAAAELATSAGCDGRNADGPGNVSPGVVIQQSGLSLLQDRTTNAVAAAPTKAVKGGGLVGAVGGVRVKLLKAGTHDLLLPMPQLTETQIPVCYTITTAPPEAAKEYRVRQREGSNTIITVQLDGSLGQEVQIDWSSVILIAGRPLARSVSLQDQYLQETPCAQSGAKEVKAQAEKLFPANGRIDDYAANIQEFIRTMKQKEQPRSMDALGILESGANWICTANANLALALLRAKGIASQSIAVIPPTGQRLEMHRIVAFSDAGRWRTFDPSSLQKDIPLHPEQNIVMARTTIGDEDMAMKPRMGTSLGCPYAQELEFLDGAMAFSGQNFFWTMGKPLAQFETTDEAIKLARMEWARFLETGQLGQGQIRAASAGDAAGFLDALATNGREPHGAASGSQPFSSETNRTSAAAGSRR